MSLIPFKRSKRPAPPKPGEPIALSEHELQLIQRGAQRGTLASAALFALSMPAQIFSMNLLDSNGGPALEAIAGAALFASTCGVLKAGYLFLRCGEIKKESALLSESSGEERVEAAALIRSIPEARRIAELAKTQGRALRIYDLLLMREARDQRELRLADRTLSRSERLN